MRGRPFEKEQELVWSRKGKGRAVVCIVFSVIVIVYAETLSLGTILNGQSSFGSAYDTQQVSMER